ncbi:MAG: hydantoinase [Candidatus Hydrogenedentota bacterium]|nr:MAG: hydantoinase [Candidatus Hydrogenedentota bacterium]
MTQASSTRRIRIGIDVGGTFTHAVAIDAATLEIVATVKVPTTHRHPRGVAAGIVESLFKLLEEGKIQSDEIVLIAHSTTQATNALLEGDVAPVGIVGMAGGMGKRRARSQTRIGDIELAPNRFLHTFHTFIDVTDGLREEQVRQAVDELLAQGAKVIVASAAFSVEDPQYEEMVVRHCNERGILVTAACHISQLYGLKARTRTAVINASMLPKMLETADMTEASVREAGIKAPLMIMRSDGGIMDIAEMRRRPILTMLSGPAAGVAAALMYARITDGIFLEVGGTSTDISAIRNGKSLVKSAVVGGHRLYLRTLDVRTVGVAGGSLPRASDHHIEDVGPRSAHIAGVEYSAFQKDLSGDLKVERFQPLPGDPDDYLRIRTEDGRLVSVTPTCASNFLGLVPEGDAAHGNREPITAAMAALCRFVRRDAQGLAEELLEKATVKVRRVVEEMIEDYELDPQLLTLSGGGGGASAIVPFTAKRMGLPFEIAPNSAVISAIGVALALVRDSIEKTVINPTEKDILQIRREAEEAVVRMGADPQSVEVEIEIDAQKNILRASATGTTELRTRDLAKAALGEEELEQRVRQSVRGQIEHVEQVASVGGLLVYHVKTVQPMLAGLIKRRTNQVRVIDREGIIRLQLRRGDTMTGTKQSVLSHLREFIEKHTTYGDAGREFPDLFLLFRGRILDLSGLINLEQIQSLAQVELASVGDNEPLAAILKF